MLQSLLQSTHNLIQWQHHFLQKIMRVRSLLLVTSQCSYSPAMPQQIAEMFLGIWPTVYPCTLSTRTGNSLTWFNNFPWVPIGPPICL